MLYMGKHMCQSQASCDDNGHLIHHLGSNKLANKMQQHVCHTSHPQGAWCNHGNTGVRCSCWSFIHRHRAEQEETDLVVRNTDCQRDVASVIQLESSFYQMSQWSVCQSVWKQELSNWPCSLWRIQHVVIAFPISTFLLLWKYRWSCCMLSSRHWCILQSFLINCCNITRTFWYCDFKCLYFFLSGLLKWLFLVSKWSYWSYWSSLLMLMDATFFPSSENRRSDCHRDIKKCVIIVFNLL